MDEVVRRLAVLESQHKEFSKMLSAHAKALNGFTDEKGVWHDGLVQTNDDIRRISAAVAPWVKSGISIIAAKDVADFLHVSLASVLKLFGG